VRATTAAPTFFTPVAWEGGLYCDGALVANNPSAIALQEAKILYPGVPLELLVSIGTGAFNQEYTEGMQSMGWDTLVNQIVASSTDTEDTHYLLNDFLSPETYYRFNPQLMDNLSIDEKDKTRLASLKLLGKRAFEEMEKSGDKRLESLIKQLKNAKT